MTTPPSATAWIRRETSRRLQTTTRLRRIVRWPAVRTTLQVQSYPDKSSNIKWCDFDLKSFYFWYFRSQQSSLSTHRTTLKIISSLHFHKICENSINLCFCQRHFRKIWIFTPIEKVIQWIRDKERGFNEAEACRKPSVVTGLQLVTLLLWMLSCTYRVSLLLSLLLFIMN